MNANATDIAYIAVGDLIPHPRNPRLITREDVIEQIAAGLQDGFHPSYALQVWRNGDGYYVLSGHHRLEAAKRAGLESVPAFVRDDLDEEQAYMVLATANAQGELSPIEIGMHALHYVAKSGGGRGKRGGLSEYAAQVGRDKGRISRLRDAAEVAKCCVDATVLLHKAEALSAIHALSEACWPGLVNEMLQKGWSARETKDVVCRLLGRPEKTQPKPPAEPEATQDAAPSPNDSHVEETPSGPGGDANFRLADTEESTQAVEHERPVSQAIDRGDSLAPVSQTRPHVSHNSGENEWYTPKEWIDAAIRVMGRIDLDPASTEEANEVVCASTIFTIDDDGLQQDWFGNVWLNPPYAQPAIRQFCDKLVYEFEAGNFESAVVLVNNATETAWFQNLVSCSRSICFPRGRIQFWSPRGEAAAPLQGQALLYLGANVDMFMAEFRDFGFVAKL